MVALAILRAAPARAQVPEVQPPELLEAPAAAYPERARQARLEASVVLRLSIDAAGSVTAAEVTEPAGHGFDEAAQEAVLHFRFRPAERRGSPVAARLLFRYEFKLPPEPAAPSGPPLPASVPVPSPTVEPKRDAAPVLPPAAAVDVAVVGAPSEAQRLQHSAESVSVIDTREARQQTADLGEVLARTQGVSVRRDGGLGSGTRFALNGLDDAQIRFFLDGVPFEVAGYPFGIANVPVNLVKRVEVYRGVVPVRFGADTLGGAVNLVGDTRYEMHAAASYQVGSFGTHRITADGRYRHEPTGLVLGVEAFLDVARNNYDVEVETANERGRLFSVTVPRFHDAYRAQGVTAEAGVVDRPWAKRLLLRAYYSSYDKELQHNVVMTLPYGAVRSAETVYGATARYGVELAPRLELELVGSYAHRIIDWVDKSTWLYNWYGQRYLEREPGGEIEPEPHDQTTWQDSAFGRGVATWSIAPQHVVRASVTSTFATRTGDERLQIDPNGIDPLSAVQHSLTVVGGIEYEINLFDGRLSNIVFVKGYFYESGSEEPVATGGLRERGTVQRFPGVGDALRFRFAPWLYAKASYEYGTRLPGPDEVFGNGTIVRPNLDLKPENSHNANLGPRLELTRTAIGDLTLDVNAFLRESKQLIMLFGSDKSYTYENLFGARSMGVESGVNWTSPGRYVGVHGALTWQDLRNTAHEGNFGKYEGDRLPNRPYLFGSWGANLHLGGITGARDSFEAFYNGRYVHWFYRGWESVGQRFYKMTVDTQVTQSVGISWTGVRDAARMVLTCEIDNVTDAKVFDNFGVQRPGRALYVKLVAEM